MTGIVSLDTVSTLARDGLLAIAIWLGVTFMLDVFSGWTALQRLYPDNSEPALLSLSMQSGWMGAIQFRGTLSLYACPTGLRLGQWRIVAPLHKRIFVPWNEVYAQQVPGLLGSKAQLSFGRTGGSLRIDTASWEELVAAAKARPTYNERRNAP